MMYRQLIFLCLSLLSTQIAYAQTDSDNKWRNGFSIGGCYNAMSAVKLRQNINNFSSSGTPLPNNERMWKFKYQAGFATGFMIKKSYNAQFASQVEFNLVMNRQKAEFSDVPPATPAAFQANSETSGSIEFNTLYLQIPLIISMNVDKATCLEGGIFINFGVLNNNKKDFKITTTSSFNNQTGQFVTFTPPKVEKNTAQPSTNTNFGWLLGVSYQISPTIALRLRYEGGMSGISDFRDLREQRLFVGAVFRKNKNK
jgi:opacity protein-like surface antigen